MIKLELTESIEKPIKEVFEFITTLSSDSLSGGWIYLGTEQTSEGPIGLGTTYIDKNLVSRLHGKIVEWEPPTKVKFYQEMKIIFPFLAFLEETTRYTLEDQGDETTKVFRDFEMDLSGIFGFMENFFFKLTIKKENERVLSVMKKKLEN